MPLEIYFQCLSVANFCPEYWGLQFNDVLPQGKVDSCNHSITYSSYHPIVVGVGSWRSSVERDTVLAVQVALPDLD